MKQKKDTVYLDHAAATPLLPAVEEVMQPYQEDYFANPQAVHQEGVAAQAVIKEARERIAKVLGVQASELVFTSGATEANALALLGAAQAYRKKTGEKPSVFLSAIAHPSVLNISVSHPEIVDVEIMSVKKSGEIDLESLPDNITGAAVVSVEHVNSEVGTLQPVRDLSQVRGRPYPLLHVDASQSAEFYNVQPHNLGVDLLTINGHKLGGPKGVGLLWVRTGTPLAPLFVAPTDIQVGDYQRLRPGTPPTALIVGLATALNLAQGNYEKNTQIVRDLQQYCLAELEASFPKMRLNGSRDRRAPHNLNVTFLGTDHDYLAAKLSAEGIVVSTTSACQAETGEGSGVLARLSNEDPRGLRISFSTETTRHDIDQLLDALKQLVEVDAKI
ncbi:MAG: cysteine desulfurase family protein [Candidatus Paceibacterota bacterium]